MKIAWIIVKQGKLHCRIQVCSNICKRYVNQITNVGSQISLINDIISGYNDAGNFRSKTAVVKQGDSPPITKYYRISNQLTRLTQILQVLHQLIIMIPILQILNFLTLNDCYQHLLFSIIPLLMLLNIGKNQYFFLFER